MTSSWRDHAACATADPELMSPAEDDPAGITTARGICGRCPVADDCLTAALCEERAARPESRDGIRGGLTPTERCAEYRRRKRAQNKPDPAPAAPPPECGTRRGYDWHRRNGEDPCRKCRDGVSAEQRARRRARAVAKWCGTGTGHQAHVRRGETPCTACVAAAHPEGDLCRACAGQRVGVPA